MQESASIHFDPIQPPPLKLWQIVLASILFVCFIGAIVYRLRRRSQGNSASLSLRSK